MIFDNSSIIKLYKSNGYITIYLCSFNSDDYWLCSYKKDIWILRVDTNINVFINYQYLYDDHLSGFVDEDRSHEKEYNKARKLSKKYVGLL